MTQCYHKKISGKVRQGRAVQQASPTTPARDSTWPCHGVCPCKRATAGTLKTKPTTLVCFCGHQPCTQQRQLQGLHAKLPDTRSSSRGRSLKRTDSLHTSPPHNIHTHTCSYEQFACHIGGVWCPTWSLQLCLQTQLRRLTAATQRPPHPKQTQTSQDHPARCQARFPQECAQSLTARLETRPPRSSKCGTHAGGLAVGQRAERGPNKLCTNTFPFSYARGMAAH